MHLVFLGQEAQPEGRIFDEQLPPVYESCEVCTFYDPVISGEGDGHDESSDDLVWIRGGEGGDFGSEPGKDSASAQSSDCKLSGGR